MEKPSVIVFTTAYHPFIGGAEIAIAEVARRGRDRFDFYIITHRMRRDLPREEDWQGARIIRVGFGTPLDRMFFFPFLACYTGLSLMRKKKRVVLWGVMVSYASIGAFFIKVFRPRTHFVLTVQEGDSEEHLRRGKMGMIDFSWRILLRFADEVTAISAYLGGVAKKQGARGRISIVPNGVDISQFKNPNPTGALHSPPVVITTSRLVKKNAVDVLVRAIAEVKKELPDIRCHVVGDGAEREYLQTLARELGVEKEILFFGAMRHADIPHALYAADIFVRVSRSEGMGNSFVEAMAAGLPVIGTRVGGITDIIKNGETGLFSAVDDPADLAQKILLLICDPDAARRIRQQGLTLVQQRFSWDMICDQYGEIFERVLRGPMSVTIATPMMPPDVGGVSQYALHLGEEFSRLGNRVSIVSYARNRRGTRKNTSIPATFISLRYPTGIRHIMFFWAMLRASRQSDVVLTLDQFSAGLPAALACLLTRTPYITRVEGDFLWESFVERTHSDITLADFWRATPHLSVKERMIRIGVRRTLAHADQVAFSSRWRKEMMSARMPFLKKKSVIIHNVWPGRHAIAGLSRPREKIIVWAGRMLILKNLDRLIRVFRNLGDTGYALHLVGDGPEKTHLQEIVDSGGGAVRLFPSMPQVELLARMEHAAFVVLPSLSDVGPNVIADAIRTATPFVMTQESGYGEFFSELGIFVNPLDERDIAEKLRMMMDEHVQSEYRRRIESWRGARDWPTAAEEWMNVLFTLRKKS